ncbi:hypothetical protein ACWGIN_27885 [Streptomyces sp. NPDC054861]
MQKIFRTVTVAGLAALTLLPGSLTVSSAHEKAAPQGGMLTGAQPVSFHDYQALRQALEATPTFCDVPGSHLDLSRITAVQNLQPEECGTVLKVTSRSNPDIPPQYVMAVDQGGRGLDLNRDTFKTLNGGVAEGLTDVAWEPVDPAYGQGILLGGPELPGCAPRCFPAPETTDPAGPPLVAGEPPQR